MRPAVAIVLAALPLTAMSAAPASAGGLSHGDRETLQRYAADTWHSFDLLLDARGAIDARIRPLLAMEQFTAG